MDGPALSGGGYGQAQLSHALGLALWLTGLRGEEVFALMSAPLDAPVELHDAISIRYGNGAIGTLSGGSAHLGAGGNKHQLEVRAIGSDGQLHVDVERERGMALARRDGEHRPARCAEATAPTTATGRRRRSSTSRSAGTSITVRPGSSPPGRSRVLDAAYRSARAAGSSRWSRRSRRDVERRSRAGGQGGARHRRGGRYRPGGRARVRCRRARGGRRRAGRAADAVVAEGRRGHVAVGADLAAVDRHDGSSPACRTRPARSTCWPTWPPCCAAGTLDAVTEDDWTFSTTSTSRRSSSSAAPPRRPCASRDAAGGS